MVHWIHPKGLSSAPQSERVNAMKEKAMEKIHKIGHIGVILSRIAMILAAIGFLGSLAITLYLCVMPDNFVTAQVDGEVLFSLNFPADWGTDLSSLASIENLSDDLKVSVGMDQVQLTDMDVRGNSLTFTGAGSVELFRLSSVRSALIAVTVSVAMTLVLTIFIGRLCQAFQVCRSPFDGAVIRRMRHLAYALIPWVVAGTVSDGFAGRIMSGGPDLTFSVNVGYIITVAVILALTFVFRYGALLQQESDGTV